jgi:hypothetical protein
MTWVRVGGWVLNTDAVTAVKYEDGQLDIFLRGDLAHAYKGGFSSQGEEAKRLWECFYALSADVMGEETLHKRVRMGDT